MIRDNGKYLCGEPEEVHGEDEDSIKITYKCSEEVNCSKHSVAFIFKPLHCALVRAWFGTSIGKSSIYVYKVDILYKISLN